MSDELENASTTGEAGQSFQQQLLQLSNKQKTLLQCFDNQKRLGSQLKVLISNQNRYSTRSKTSLQQAHSQEHTVLGYHRNNKGSDTQVEAPKVAMVSTSHYRRYKPVQPVKSSTKLPSSSQLTTSVMRQLKQSTVFGTSKVSSLDNVKSVATKNQQSQHSTNQQVTSEKSQLSVDVTSQQKQYVGISIHSVSMAEQKQVGDKATQVGDKATSELGKTQQPTSTISHQEISVSNATQHLQKPVGVATQEQNPVGVATQQQNPVGVATQNQNPVSVAAQQQAVGMASQQQKVVGVATQQQKTVQQLKTVGTATKQKTVGGATQEQKTVGVVTQQQKTVGVAMHQMKPVGVATDNQSMETKIPHCVVQHSHCMDVVEQPVFMQQPVNVATQQHQPMVTAGNQPMETDAQPHLMGVAMSHSQLQQPVSMQQTRGVATKQQRPISTASRLLLHSELAQPVPLDVLVQHQLISPQDQCLTCTLMVAHVP